MQNVGLSPRQWDSQLFKNLLLLFLLAGGWLSTLDFLNSIYRDTNCQMKRKNTGNIYRNVTADFRANCYAKEIRAKLF